MDAGGYTYVLVDTGTNKLWAAATQFQVKQGDLVAVPDAMPMTDFHSKALNRDFSGDLFRGQHHGEWQQFRARHKLPPGHPAIGEGASGELPAGHPPTAE